MELDRNEQAVAAPRSVQVGKLLLVLAKPTAADELHIQSEWRRQCLATAKTPLQSILDDLKSLPPAMAQIAIEAAVKTQAASGEGGKVEPDEDKIFARLFTIDGLSYRLWHLARKADPALTLAAVRAEVEASDVAQVIADAFPQGEEQKKT